MRLLTAIGDVVVDTGQGAHLLETGRSLHPYVRWEVVFRIEPEEEIAPQLRVLGIGPRDVKQVVLTHLHMDRDGGVSALISERSILDANTVALALIQQWVGPDDKVTDMSAFYDALVKALTDAHKEGEMKAKMKPLLNWKLPTQCHCLHTDNPI